MQPKITTIAELERTHLRFLKVQDNKKLSDILAKLLPSILLIYFEQDLENVALTSEQIPTQSKIMAIEEIVKHLLMKVTNAKGEVKIPIHKLIGIFYEDIYINFQNPHVKNHGKNRIFDFIFSAYPNQERELASDQANIFEPIIKCLAKLNDKSQEKASLLVILIHRLSHYQKAKQGTQISKLFRTIFDSINGVKPAENDAGAKIENEEMKDEEEKEDPLKRELLSTFYNFVTIFQQPDSVQNNLMVQNVTQTMQFVFETFRDKTNLEDTWANFVVNSNLVILGIVSDKEFVKNQDSIPLILLMSLGKFGLVADIASSQLKSYQQDIDRWDHKLVNNIFKMINNINIYQEESELQSQRDLVLQNQQSSGMKEMPVLTKMHMILFLLKFDVSAQTDQKGNIALIESCIARHEDFIGYAVKLIKHMIQFNQDIINSSSGESELAGGFNIIQQLKFQLIKIRNLKESQESDDVLQQLSQAQVFTCLADLGAKSYGQIFNSQSLSISMLTIEVFEKLRSRIEQIANIKPIRDDELCLIYMESLNKYRDIIESHKQDPQIQSEKQILMSLVYKNLNKELAIINQSQVSGNNELVYILFLYLSSLDQHKNAQTGKEVPNPSILLYAISIKEHEDIKIRKEAAKQIEKFEKLVSELSLQQNSEDLAVKQSGRDQMKTVVLGPLIQEVKKFFTRNSIPIFDDLYKLKSYLNLQQGTAFQDSVYTPLFLEQCLQISRFTMELMLQVYDGSDQMTDGSLDQDSEIFDVVQRQLLMNINWSFTSIKVDFQEPLKLIKKLIKICERNSYVEKNSDILCSVGALQIHKFFSLGNLDQQILRLKILNKLNSKCMDSNHKQAFKTHLKINELIENENSTKKVSHEADLRRTIDFTLAGLMASEDELLTKINSIVTSKVNLVTEQVNKSMSPNVKEHLKLLVICTGILSRSSQFQEKTLFESTGSLIFAVLKNKEISGASKSTEGGASVNAFRIHLIKSLFQITMGSANDAKKEEICLQLLNSHIEQDYHDVQTVIGKSVAKVFKSLEAHLTQKEEDSPLFKYVVGFLMVFIKSREKEFEVGSFISLKEDEMQIDSSKNGKLPISLTTRRNCVIYLNEALQIYGNSETFISERFVEIQKIFLKYIFDKKQDIQDISSKALTLIYKSGSPEVKESLVQSLSSRLTGENSSNIGGETNDDKDEDRELNLEFHDTTSQEQRKKLKTYKDLCKIAVEFGHKEMIYQFLEVHRHVSQYQDIKNAAKGLSNIILLDERLKNDLLKITPKILMLTYDYNEEVRDTMRQLWGTLIDVKEEQQVIEDKWPEILKEALASMKQKEFRKRQSAALVLIDYLPNRTWAQVKDHFKELFLGSLALLDDDIESVKKAAVNLTNTNKRLTLKFANIYSNNNIEELKEILAILIPMVIDEVIKSQMKEVKFYGVNMLFEIIKSSTQERMYQNLKIQNKYERQLAFNYNDEKKMKEILNPYLDRIIIEVLSNLSQMNFAQEQINQIEQYAISKNIYSKYQGSEKNTITESMVNDLRIKYSRDSEWGEILNICRKQMDQKCFESILNDLLSLIIKGHDMVTKSAAIMFVQDIILENKLELIDPKNSRKIAQTLVNLFQQNSVGFCQSISEPLLQLYAGLLGLQFKILRAFPNTTQQIVASIISLSDELEQIKSILLFEIMKNLPAEMIREGGNDSQLLIQDAIPMYFINKYKTDNQRLKVFSERVWKYLKDTLTEAVDEEGDKVHDNFVSKIEIQNSEAIFKKILILLDSNNYDERISAGLALEDLSKKMDAQELGQSEIVSQIIQKMLELINGKYFNNKELLVDSFCSLMQLMESSSPWCKNKEFQVQFLQTCLKQIEKFSNQNPGYKNKMIESMNHCLKQSGIETLDPIIENLYVLLIVQLSDNLEFVSQSQSLTSDNAGTSTFEEKKDDEKQVLQCISQSCVTLSLVFPAMNGEYQSGVLSQFMSSYGTTNFLVRNSFLKAIISIMALGKQKESSKLIVPEEVMKVIDFILCHTAKCGEKFDMNLELLSQMCLMVSSSDISISFVESINKNSLILIEILKEKGGDGLVKNIDLIRSNLGL